MPVSPSPEAGVGGSPDVAGALVVVVVTGPVDASVVLLVVDETAVVDGVRPEALD